MVKLSHMPPINIKTHFKRKEFYTFYIACIDFMATKKHYTKC